LQDEVAIIAPSREGVWGEALQLEPLMKLIKNSGTDRVVDELRRVLGAQSSLDVVA